MSFEPFTVDSTNVFGASVQEAGTYNVKITNAEVGTTGRGDDKLTIDYEVLDGDYKGRAIRYHTLTWLDETQEAKNKSITRFNTFVVALGAKDDTKMMSLAKIAQSAMGKSLTIDVAWSELYNGKSHLEVRAQHPLSSEPSKPNGIRRPDGNATQAPIGATAGNDPFATASNTTAPDISDDDLLF